MLRIFFCSVGSRAVDCEIGPVDRKPDGECYSGGRLQHGLKDLGGLIAGKQIRVGWFQLFELPSAPALTNVSWKIQSR